MRKVVRRSGGRRSGRRGTPDSVVAVERKVYFGDWGGEVGLSCVSVGGRGGTVGREEELVKASFAGSDGGGPYDGWDCLLGSSGGMSQFILASFCGTDG